MLILIRKHARLDCFYKSPTAKQSIDLTVIKPSPSRSNIISNDKLTAQIQLNKSLSQSCSEISGNLLNINTPTNTLRKSKRHNCITN